MCSQSLSLFAVHCCWRYVNVTGNYRFLFDRWYCVVMVGFISFLFSAAYGATLGVFMQPTPERTEMSRHVLETEYNATVETLGYIGSYFQYPDANGVMHYHKLHILATAISETVIFIIYLTTCIVGVRLFFFVQNGVYSSSARSMHMQLLGILLAQGTAPLITDFFPLSIVLTGGLFGIFPLNTSKFVPILVSSYPGIDAVMIIFLFKAYRQRFIYCIKKCMFFWRNHEHPSQRTSMIKSVSVTRIIGQHRLEPITRETTHRQSAP